MPINLMYFILGDQVGKRSFTSLGVDPNPDSTRRAGLLAAIAGPVGLVLGLRNAQKDAEAAAAAAVPAAPATVPDLRGATLDDATTEIKVAGLKIKAVSTEPSAPADKDKVTRTDPGAGSARPADLNITIFLGTGIPPEPVKVPEVKGKTLIEATPLIEAAGLTISALSTEPSGPDNRDKITRTNPAAGSDLPADLKIKVFVGTGIPATVPRVKGQTEEVARTQIEAAGGKVKEVKTEPSADTEKDLVTSTNPAAGEALPDDGVTIFLGAGTGKS